MSAPTKKTASALEDYLGLFRALEALGVEFVVIGGGAVGAYARLVGDTVFSDDLDIFVTHRALETVVSDAAAVGATVHKLPAPRSVPVAVLEWNGREINLITSTNGLPPPDVVARTAREFRIGDPASLSVLIADPFDLLRNKLAVNRPKDQPHIAILKKFLEEEAVHGFREETDPRARIATAERLLEVLGTQTLEQPLAERSAAAGPGSGGLPVSGSSTANGRVGAAAHSGCTIRRGENHRGDDCRHSWFHGQLTPS